MRVTFIDSINRISKEQWNSVTGVDYPFTRYEFLYALESSGATCKESGWQPYHALIYDNDADVEDLIAVMPLYLKYHSYGEYIFDWAWADAYRQHGISYYPKLLSAIPYTPATGQRLCVKDPSNTQQVTQRLIESIYEQVDVHQASSIHVLFPSNEESLRLQTSGLQQRKSSQFHWFNNNFTSFDDFLATFNSRKRKNLKKERRKVSEQDIQISVLEGHEISNNTWQTFHDFYQMTYAKRSGHMGYLNLDFFTQIAKTMPEHIVLVQAHHNNQPIAGALNFRDSHSLYGRYWGCTKEFEFLHFEVCYYQGIEFCIANKLLRFDPGAQGEHKIQRGFTPVETWSNHWIAHPGFSDAIDDFLNRESQHVATYIKEAKKLLPFKK